MKTSFWCSLLLDGILEKSRERDTPIGGVMNTKYRIQYIIHNTCENVRNVCFHICVMSVANRHVFNRENLADWLFRNSVKSDSMSNIRKN